MSKEEMKRKEIIERALIDSMNSIDDALTQIVCLKTENDNINYNRIFQCKANIKKVLQRDYDKCAHNRQK